MRNLWCGEGRTLSNNREGFGSDTQSVASGGRTGRTREGVDPVDVDNSVEAAG